MTNRNSFSWGCGLVSIFRALDLSLFWPLIYYAWNWKLQVKHQNATECELKNRNPGFVMKLQPTLFTSPHSHPRLNSGGSTLPQPTSCGPDWWHTSCTAVVNRGAGKTPNWPPPLLWQSQIPFQEKPNSTSHSWVLEMARKCKHWWQYSSTSPRDNKDTTPTSRSSSSALVCSSGDKLLPVLQAGNSEPLLITMITSWFCFLWTSLPLPAFEEATCHMLSGMFWNRPV